MRNIGESGLVRRMSKGLRAEEPDCAATSCIARHELRSMLDNRDDRLRGTTLSRYIEPFAGLLRIVIVHHQGNSRKRQ